MDDGRQNEAGTPAKPSAPRAVEAARPRHFVTALARGLDVLGCFTPERPVLGASEIARMLGLPQPTVWRLCFTLIELGHLVFLHGCVAKTEAGVIEVARQRTAGGRGDGDDQEGVGSQHPRSRYAGTDRFRCQPLPDCCLTAPTPPAPRSLLRRSQQNRDETVIRENLSGLQEKPTPAWRPLGDGAAPNPANEGRPDGFGPSTSRRPMVAERVPGSRALSGTRHVSATGGLAIVAGRRYRRVPTHQDRRKTAVLRRGDRTLFGELQTGDWGVGPAGPPPQRAKESSGNNRIGFAGRLESAAATLAAMLSDYCRTTPKCRPFVPRRGLWQQALQWGGVGHLCQSAEDTVSGLRRVGPWGRLPGRSRGATRSSSNRPISEKATRNCEHPQRRRQAANPRRELRAAAR